MKLWKLIVLYFILVGVFGLFVSLLMKSMADCLKMGGTALYCFMSLG